MAFRNFCKSKKIIAAQHTFTLCSSLYVGLHHVGHSGDELAVGRFAPGGGDGVAEVFLQHIQVSPGPGHLDEVTDGTPKIPFIGIFMA